jgi:dipeptidyl aminopeptidase/acylaminoacyl peptidase
VDEIQYASLPPQHVSNPEAPAPGTLLSFRPTHSFPKDLDRGRKKPLIVYAHGGVHANFSSGQSTHIVRDSSLKGIQSSRRTTVAVRDMARDFHEQIDFGGREVDDVDAARAWMLDAFLEPKHVGFIGWSHGGMITRLNIFRHANDYVVAYAAVPVSDLVARMGYESEGYRKLFSAPYHTDKTVREDIAEYRKRSPVSHAAELETPLLIHTNTNDEDVNVLEVQNLIAALKGAGKKFEYKIYDNAPGGHMFNRIDTRLARDSRLEVWRFLSSYLHPANAAQ